ncbi:hypothetical protein REL07_003740 [Clostridioides difficile]|nr:hypothetical protein [Clostridioides difficile]MBG0203305.1 hypothetical protein [Clostridioides difficile]MBG0210178.1 hypothetical protein [Clostridioides difficile]MBH7077849.1 hypothetical protein [Clostridioides difficile]MBH8063105.1 hypothetical protein [Clostridioides difficile]
MIIGLAGGGFILTNWYVNVQTDIDTAQYQIRFILTKWYVKPLMFLHPIQLKPCFILTKWYVKKHTR